MKSKSVVFVGVLEDGRFLVSTTLKGLCRLMGLKYEATAKAWKRWSGAGGKDRVDDQKEIGGCNPARGEGSWKIVEVEVDTTWRKGNPDFGKTIKAGGGFRGYRGPEGVLENLPAEKAGKKVMMGSKEEQEILRQRSEWQQE